MLRHALPSDFQEWVARDFGQAAPDHKLSAIQRWLTGMCTQRARARGVAQEPAQRRKINPDVRRARGALREAPGQLYRGLLDRCPGFSLDLPELPEDANSLHIVADLPPDAGQAVDSELA
jgi:hypothetical protein